MPTGLAEKHSLEHTSAALEAVYNWNYEPEIDQLRTLYANALERQWIAVRDLDWEGEIDREAFSRSVSLANARTVSSSWPTSARARGSSGS